MARADELHEPDLDGLRIAAQRVGERGEVRLAQGDAAPGGEVAELVDHREVLAQQPVRLGGSPEMADAVADGE